jgi:hypothetical protein
MGTGRTQRRASLAHRLGATTVYHFSRAHSS